MAKFGIAPGPSRARRKIATAFAAAGALLLSSGMVVMAAAPASADRPGDRFWVCKWTATPIFGEAASHINPASTTTTEAGGFFKDAQVWSKVIGPSATEPPLSACGTFGGGAGKTPVVPVTPTVTSSVCQNGAPTDAVVNDPADGDGISYAVNGSTVTATIDPLTHEWGTLTGLWQEVDASTATYTVPASQLADAVCGGGGNPIPPVVTPDVDELVTPLYPSTTDANCSRDGRLVVPTQPAGVLVEQTGTAPGDVTFSYTPATGYAFPAGTDTEVTVTVPAQLTGDDCIKGVETSRPKPTPGAVNPGGDGPAAAPVKGGTDAEVLGEQAVAVPTAVAAGLGDTMTATSTGSPQLAQALVAAGLLMLVMGGATGLGRRTRGAHES